jgi:hypothetical protein
MYSVVFAFTGGDEPTAVPPTEAPELEDPPDFMRSIRKNPPTRRIRITPYIR